jgi:hypothetical protein
MQEHFLAEHIHLCRTAGGVIGLDVRKQTYIGLPADVERVLQRHVVGWLNDEGTREPLIQESDKDEAVLAELVADGIITNDARNGRVQMRIDLATDDEIAFGEIATVSSRVRAKDVVAFLLSCGIARAVIRFGSIAAIIARIGARKRLCGLATSTDSQSTREMATRFLCLRPLVFSQAGACLFDSLALLEFLTRYRLSAEMVFAVKSGPFQAHAWVQSGTTVLNDSTANVKEFTPILVV